MGFGSNTALLLLVSVPIIGWSGISFAYRPFDSTDAAVAAARQLEVEFGPVQFRRSNEEQTVIAPAYVLNFGFAKDWELVLEGRREHSLPPADDTRARFVGDALFLKGVLREGALQDKSGPSVAVEFGPLLPGLHDEQGWGASWVGIVSQRWSGGTIHFNLGAALTREPTSSLGPSSKGRMIGQSAPLPRSITSGNSTRQKRSRFWRERFGRSATIFRLTLDFARHGSITNR